MFGTLLSEATAQTNWAALLVNFTAGNTLATCWVLTSWTLEHWSALQDLAAAIVLGLNDRLTLGTEWRLWWITSSWDTLVLAWAAALFTRNNVSHLSAFAFTAGLVLDGWALFGLVFGRTGEAWKALLGGVALILAWSGLEEIVVLLTSEGFWLWNAHCGWDTLAVINST
jgi:hypothetical protein